KWPGPPAGSAERPTLRSPPAAGLRRQNRQRWRPHALAAAGGDRGAALVDGRRRLAHADPGVDVVVAFDQVLAADAQADVVPGQPLVERPLAMGVPGRVDAGLGVGGPPDRVVVAFVPAVEASAAAPGRLDDRAQPPIAARHHA